MRKSSPESKSAFFNAAARKKTDWKVQRAGEWEFFSAVMRNDTELVGRMLEAWPKAAQWRQNPLHPKGEHMTALIHAARWGHKEMTELLIAHGAPLDAQDSNAISALAHAVRLGRKEVVKVLLEKGANPSAITKPYVIGEKPERFDILDMLKDALDAANSKPRTEQGAKPAAGIKGKAPKK